jgi:hypothetical protein
MYVQRRVWAVRGWVISLAASLVLPAGCDSSPRENSLPPFNKAIAAPVAIRVKTKKGNTTFNVVTDRRALATGR